MLTFDAISGIGEGTWSAFTGATTGVAATATCKEGSGGVTFNKTGVAGFGGVTNSTIPAFDLTSAAYHGLWVYLPTIATFANVLFRFGSDLASHYNTWRWSRPAGYPFVAGWNYLRFALDASLYDGSIRSFAVTGAPVNTAITGGLIGLEFSPTSDTYSGMIIDWMKKHPYRYSTGKVKQAEAPTKAGWMQVPSLGMNSTRVQEGSITVSAGSFNIIDSDGATLITDMKRFFMPGRIVTCLAGSRSESELLGGAYGAINKGLVFAPQHLGRSFQFQCNDLLEKLARPFMQGATEAAPITISGTGINVLLRLALSTGLGTNNPTYDTLPATQGVGLHQDYFDLDAFEDIELDFGLSDLVEFTFKEPEPDFLQWMQREIFLPLGYSPSISSDGRLTASIALPPYGDDTLVELDLTNVVTKMPQFTQSLDNLYNQIIFYYNYDALTDTYLSEPTLVDNAASQERYGLRSLTVRSKGIVSSATATRCGKRIISRLGNGAPPIILEALMSQQPRRIGEVVRLTHPHVPDLETGVYGISEALVAVDGRGFNPQTSKTQLNLAQTSYQAGGYRRIAPAALAVYTSQTDQQKRRYASIAGADETFSNGDASHNFGPG